MATNTSGYSRKVLRLLENEDLEGLVALLRQPELPELRSQAALALGDLNNYDATELMVRARREDPEPQVRAAALQALTSMFGSELNNVLAGYAETTPEDAWLVEPQKDEYEDEEDDDDDGNEEPDENRASPAMKLNLSDIELEGIIRVARHEGNHKLRLQAIHVLGRSPNQAAIDTLADLALWGDGSAIRLAARRALESLYGDGADEILENYRAAQNETETADEDDEEGDDYDEDEDLDEEDDDGEEEEEDGDDENDDDDDDDDEQEEESPYQQPIPSIPVSTRSEQFKPNPEPVTEEMGLPWRLLIGLVVLAGVAILIFMWIGR